MLHEYVNVGQPIDIFGPLIPEDTENFWKNWVTLHYIELYKLCDSAWDINCTGIYGTSHVGEETKRRLQTSYCEE